MLCFPQGGVIPSCNFFQLNYNWKIDPENEPVSKIQKSLLILLSSKCYPILFITLKLAIFRNGLLKSWKKSWTNLEIFKYGKRFSPTISKKFKKFYGFFAALIFEIKVNFGKYYAAQFFNDCYLKSVIDLLMKLILFYYKYTLLTLILFLLLYDKFL